MKALVFVVALVASLGIVPAKPPCTVAVEWASARAASGTLPSTLSSLSTVSPLYRRAAFAHFSSTQRRDLWTEQVRAFSVSRPFTAAEAALLTDTLRYLDGAFTRTPTEADRAFALRLLNAFPKDRDTFLTLGAVVRTRPVVRGAAIEWCGCSTNFGGYDCNGLSCLDSASCWALPQLCGAFYLWPCDGACGASCPPGRPCPAVAGRG